MTVSTLRRADRVSTLGRVAGVSLALLMMLALAGVAVGVWPKQLIANAAQPPVGLGTANSFAVLAGQGVTNTGTTTINGDIGSYPNAAETGVGPCPAADCVDLTGTDHAGDAVTKGAKADLTTAYNDAAGRTPVTTISTELDGATLTAGVYDSQAGTFLNSGTLTLDAEGDPNATFIFQMASTLITASDSTISLVNGAQNCNIFWQVGSSATLGTSSTFRGTIMALQSIQVTTGVTVFGRVLARTASVTLDTDTIRRSPCGPPPTSPPPTSPPPTSPPPTSPPPTTPPPTTPPPTTPAPTTPAPTTPAPTTPAPTTPAPTTPPPSGGPQTGGGSTAGGNDVGLLVIGGALLAMALGAFAVRRPIRRKGSSS